MTAVQSRRLDMLPRAVALAGLVTLMTTSVTVYTQEHRTGIERVAWLEGCWESVTPQRAIEEQWMAPRGTSMLMMGRTVRGGKLLDYELVVLREDGDRLAYEAHPAGQPGAVFRSTVVSANQVVFENPEHDFPQRVGYERVDADGLTAWIDGTQNGAARRVEFVYRRARCGQ